MLSYVTIDYVTEKLVVSWSLSQLISHLDKCDHNRVVYERARAQSPRYVWHEWNWLK